MPFLTPSAIASFFELGVSPKVLFFLLVSRVPESFFPRRLAACKFVKPSFVLGDQLTSTFWCFPPSLFPLARSEPAYRTLHSKTPPEEQMLPILELFVPPKVRLLGC